MKSKRKIFFGMVSAALISLVPTSALAYSEENATSSHTSLCEEAARDLVSSNQKNPDDSYEFACIGEMVSVTVDTDGTEPQQFTQSIDSLVNEAAKESYLVNCSPMIGTIRTITSHLQNNIEFCVFYGQTNHKTNGSWARSIVVEWTMFPGWNSAQNRIRTIPSVGSPKLTGTVSSRKQHGILPPSVLTTSVWTNNGNTTTTGWNVGGLTTGGSHSVALNDLEVTDSSYNFNYYIGDEIPSHRFLCDTAEMRCYFPGGQEAGL